VVAATAPPLSLADVRDQAADLAEAGRFTQAAELLTRRIRGALESPADLRGARFQLAHTLLLGGEFARALPEFQALGAELAGLRGASDEDVLQCRVQIATCHSELGEITAAIEELTVVLLIRRAERGEADTEVLDLRRQIGLLLASSGDLPRAERALRELHADMERELGVGHLAVGELREVLDRVEAARRASSR
jgi:tetratricopeptide (TPR) repeat protein